MREQSCAVSTAFGKQINKIPPHPSHTFIESVEPAPAWGLVSFFGAKFSIYDDIDAVFWYDTGNK